jgi:hypothetical protein
MSVQRLPIGVVVGRISGVCARPGAARCGEGVGWAVDLAAEGWAGIDDVQVRNGGTVLAHGSVAGDRPDVVAATGNPFWAATSNPFWAASGFDVPGSSGGASEAMRASPTAKGGIFQTGGHLDSSGTNHFS